MIGDIYSPAFRSNLKKWLQSIPDYPKPFDMTFLTLTEVLAGLGKHFIDEECKQQCSTFTLDFVDDEELKLLNEASDENQGVNSGKDFCIKPQEWVVNKKSKEMEELPSGAPGVRDQKTLTLYCVEAQVYCVHSFLVHYPN